MSIAPAWIKYLLAGRAALLLLARCITSVRQGSTRRWARLSIVRSKRRAQVHLTMVGKDLRQSLRRRPGCVCWR